MSLEICNLNVSIEGIPILNDVSLFSSKIEAVSLFSDRLGINTLSIGQTGDNTLLLCGYKR